MLPKTHTATAGYAQLRSPDSPQGPAVPKLAIPHGTPEQGWTHGMEAGAPGGLTMLTPRSAGAAVDRAVAEREMAAASAADKAEDAREAQLTARREANAASDAADAAALRAAAARSDDRAQQEMAAAKASAAAAEAAAAAAAREAQLTSRKAEIEKGFVAASAGSFQLVSSGAEVVTFDREDLALREATTRWWPWILYHEQRGSFTEITCGGFRLPFAHTAIRRHVSEVMHARLNQVYGANY